jgi:hypothetical protein
LDKDAAKKLWLISLELGGLHGKRE